MDGNKMKTKLIRITMFSDTWDSEIDALVRVISRFPIVIDVEEMD